MKDSELPTTVSGVVALCEEWKRDERSTIQLDRNMTTIKGAISLQQKAIRDGKLSLGDSESDFLFLAFGLRFPEAREAFARYHEQLKAYVGEPVMAITRTDELSVHIGLGLGPTGFVARNKLLLFETERHAVLPIRSKDPIRWVAGPVEMFGAWEASRYCCYGNVGEKFYHYVGDIKEVDTFAGRESLFLIGSAAINAFVLENYKMLESVVPQLVALLTQGCHVLPRPD